VAGRAVLLSSAPRELQHDQARTYQGRLSVTGVTRNQSNEYA
jgi:hypothetical protein